MRNMERKSDCIAVYPFLDGFILHKELEIDRVDKDFNEIWYFNGGDVFVTKDQKKYPPVRIVGEEIELYDWNNVFYRLNAQGQVIERIA